MKKQHANKKAIVSAVGAAALTLTLAQPATAGWFGWFQSDDNSTYAETDNPIVLVHGLAGFDDIFGLVEYFNGIPDALSDEGAEVFVPQVSAANSTEVRGEQLLSQIQDFLATTDADQVNIIGHSHGGPTARYVAGVAPHLVASVSSVGGVNWGTPVADFASKGQLGSVGDIFFDILDSTAGGGLPQDTDAALYALSTDGSVAFNQNFPDGLPSNYCGNDGAAQANGVRYYSWGGDGVFTNLADPSDYFLSLTSKFIDEANDGLVPSCSMKLGEVISVNYDHNHLDQVNQVLGLTGSNAVDPVDLYIQHANRLKNAGL